jgi:tripartite-type tricarboxylate transporter receptor subunit TctC
MRKTSMSRRRLLATAGGTATALMASGAARAQADYPARPVRLIVPFPAGGATDILGRLVGQKLTEALGQQFVVENKPGAGGNIGAALAAQSPPDGYTLFMGSPGTHAVNAHLYDKPGYDGIKDFDPISLVVKAPNLMVVHPSFPATTLGEFIDYARKNPGLTYGHTSNGGTKHLAGELLRLKANIDIVPVAYKGSAPMMADLVAGHLKVAFDDLITSLQHVNNKSIRALAITGDSRWPSVPDVPRVSELGGVFADYDVTAWYGLLAPARTPAAIIGKVNAIVAKALQDKTLRDDLFAKGVEPIGSSPKQFQEFIAAEYVRWGDVVRRSGIKLS